MKNNPKEILFLLSAILLMALGVLALLKHQKEKATQTADFLPELSSGIGKGIGAIMLLVIVLVGGLMVMLFFGIGYTAKKGAKVGEKVGKSFEENFDQNLDRTKKVAETVKVIKGK